MARPLHRLATMRSSPLLVLAIGAGLGGCIVVDSVLTVDCIEHIHQTAAFPTPNDDTALQFKIDRCELDSDACTELCTLALQRSGVGNPVTGCSVDFSTAQVTVNVTFDQATNAPGCPSQFTGSGGISNGSAMPTPSHLTGSGN